MKTQNQMDGNNPETEVELVGRTTEPGSDDLPGPPSGGSGPVHDRSGEKEKRGFGLWGYLFVCFGIVAAVPVLILGINEAQRLRKVQLEEIGSEGTFAAESLAREISKYVGSHVQAVETLAGQVQALGTLNPKVIRSLITPQKTLFGNFSFMYIADRDGRSMISEPPLDEDGRPTAGTDYSDRDYYKKLMTTGKTSISRAQVGKLTHVPNVQIVSPIRNGAGKILGFAEGSLDLTGIQEAADRFIKGMPGVQVAVVDDQGRVIAHPDEGYRLSVKNLLNFPLFQPSSGPDVVYRSEKDSHGIMMRAAVVGIRSDGLNWTVIVYQPESVLEEQAGAARKQAFWVAAVALLAGLAFATMLAAGLTRPVRRLAAVATAVGRGNFSDFPSRPGSWMPREMAALQIALREMVLQLRNYTRELESRVKERTAQLKEKNLELESFVYTVSHDLKTPVVSLHGMASVLLEDYSGKLDDQGKHYLQRVMANATFMEQLIEDLLALSRTTRRVRRPENIDTERLIEDVLGQCQEMIKRKGALVRVHSPLPRAVFDPIQLRQVFLNLVTNGIKFIGPSAAPSIEIGGERGAGYVQFFVKDNGIGIDPRYHDLIFGIFQRLREVDVEGTGVGLAIVKKIIDSARGKIWIESEKGKGAAFFFRIPSQEPVTEAEP